jgi:adenylate kinase family enzyme
MTKFLFYNIIICMDKTTKTSIYLLIGLSNSGKGTIGNFLKNTGYKVIAMGDLIRSKFPSGTLERDMIDKGHLLDHKITRSILHEEIQSHNCVFLDGYPRLVADVEFLKDRIDNGFYAIKHAFLLDVPVEILYERCLNRTYCTICHKTFSGTNFCCGVSTNKREDDTLEIFTKKLDIQRLDFENTINSLKSIVSIRTIKAISTPQIIFNEIKKFIK